MKPRLGSVGALLFSSGLCALIYQLAWFRELRLVFGASTAASSAVLAIFMGGLGVGGALLGKRADLSKAPLAMYARLEITVACGAALTPLLVDVANRVYLASGGTSGLGRVGATALRIALSIVVLGPITFLMGGTLPAAARAVARKEDTQRRDVAVLYGVNTAGAVVGTLLANFVLLETLGTRLTLWCAAALNILVGVVASSLARRAGNVRSATAEDPDEGAPAEPSTHAIPRWAPPGAAALAGAAFMLMELTWYRMLAPLLGGSSYTFGLILAVALVGIGLGGGLYARTRIPSSLRAFAVTCALEALAIVIPYALGDGLAMATLVLRPVCRAGFGASVAVWTLITCVAVLPAAIVAGAQFPLIIGLYGGREQHAGRDVGAAYLANTLGSIGGALAGGFVLLPALGALGVWKLVVAALAAGSVIALVLAQRDDNADRPRFVRLGLLALIPVGFLFCQGPSAVWRHSGIGAGRADVKMGTGSPSELAAFRRGEERAIRWEADGVESSVANDQRTGFSFVVNGKGDGHAVADAPTQVMGGLLASLLHGAPHDALVIGLGTGSTAGWLGKVPTIERVDVVELEPAILGMARDCAPVNGDVMNNPKVHVTIEDARENLRTTRSRYDVIFSEPSNPYRAGISSLYTLEFYQAARARLQSGGLFMQWMQAYEVDDWAIATAIGTLHRVFPDVEVWRTMRGDLVIVARVEHHAIDSAKTSALLETEPYASATRAVWKSSGLEALLSHFVARSELADVIVEKELGALNTDDQNFLEFAFARHVGRKNGFADDNIASLARRLGFDRPDVVGAYDPARVQDESWLYQLALHDPLSPSLTTVPPTRLGRAIFAASVSDFTRAFEVLRKLPADERQPSDGERALFTEAAVRGGPPSEVLERVAHGVGREAPFLAAVGAMRLGDRTSAAVALAQLFVAARTDPWINVHDFREASEMAISIARSDPTSAPLLSDSLAQPFAVENEREGRLGTRAHVAVFLPDSRGCVDAFKALEPPPWDKSLLTLRTGCYAKNNDPDTVKAERDLRALLELDPSPLGASLRSP